MDTQRPGVVIIAALAVACSDRTPTDALELRKVRANEEAIAWSDWSAPLNLGPVVNSDSADQHPGISKDGLSLYFGSNRAGGYGGLDLYVTRRDNLEAPWGPPVNLGPLVNSDAPDFAPNFTPGGHQLFFHSGRSGGCGALDLYVARRRDRQDAFGWEAPANLGCVVNSAFDDAGPTVVEDEATGVTTLTFNSSRPSGPGGLDIYQSTRVGDAGAFGPAVLIPELSGPFRDTRTAISRNGLELFLSSDVTGRVGGIGGQDIWSSARATTADPWSTPVNLGAGVNTTAFDGGPALSFDGTTLYFFSNRSGGSGGNDLYVTTRSRLR